MVFRTVLMGLMSRDVVSRICFLRIVEMWFDDFTLF